MPIRVKVDEDLPTEVAAILAKAGADAATVVGQGWVGMKDDDLWPLVQAENRILVTADKGFADARRQPVGAHAGIVLFRLRAESRAGYIELARRLVKHCDLHTLAGAVTVISPAAIRVHRGP